MVNAGKSKVIISSSGGNIIVNSGKWPCGVCEKGVQTNSVKCTVCKKWIHKQCSGVRVMSLVVDGYHVLNTRTGIVSNGETNCGVYPRPILGIWITTSIFSVHQAGVLSR